MYKKSVTNGHVLVLNSNYRFTPFIHNGYSVLCCWCLNKGTQCCLRSSIKGNHEMIRLGSQ